MMSKSAEKKINKKQKRCQHMLSLESNIQCTNENTPVTNFNNYVKIRSIVNLRNYIFFILVTVSSCL